MYTNSLSEQSSPYLRQHAHDPVDWQPWGPAVFERACREDKPLFISIGYSTCHWCHVMARESFSDSEVAQRLNQDFVAVKVDREERPDVDALYMHMAQLLGSGGGWPASIFASPDGKPFYAGTYFPREQFLHVLESVAAVWRTDRAQMLQNGELVLQAMNVGSARRRAAADVPVHRAVQQLRDSFDEQFGGFGLPPKFPTPHMIMLMLRFQPAMAEKTLVQMYRGGIFDHIGGGFCRYSTDRFWLVPHFEKMLCDNALLAMTYLLAWEQTGRNLYREVALRVLRYMEEELLSPEGGFYAAQDADSDGEEGKYYLFTPDELKKLLGEHDGERFSRKYGISRSGHIDGASVPNLLRDMDGENLDALTERVRSYRRERCTLHTDKKQLTSWNGLAACAYAWAGRILREEEYLQKGRALLNFIESRLNSENGLRACITEGKTGGSAFLDDYAYLAWACYEMYEATGAPEDLQRACRLTEKAVELFFDDENGGFYFTGRENEPLVARIKESRDGALPSGNSVMAYILSRLSLLTENEHYAALLEKQRGYMNAQAQSHPAGYAFYLWSALPVKKVVCASPEAKRPGDLRVRTNWAFRCTDSDEYPLLNGGTAYYVCTDDACLPPQPEPPSD